MEVTEPDLKGLSKPFILKVMKKCLEDHDNMHCYDGCEDAVVCTPETCPEPEWLQGDSADVMDDHWAFFHNQQASSRHVLGSESISVIEVVDLEAHSNRKPAWGCLHSVELCYTNGQLAHDWRAIYGVHEETDLIQLWAD